MGGPGSDPFGHQGVVLRTVCKHPVDTEVVLASTVCACVGWQFARPEGGIVRIP